MSKVIVHHVVEVRRGPMGGGMMPGEKQKILRALSGNFFLILENIKLELLQL